MDTNTLRQGPVMKRLSILLIIAFALGSLGASFKRGLRGSGVTGGGGGFAGAYYHGARKSTLFTAAGDADLTVCSRGVCTGGGGTARVCCIDSACTGGDTCVGSLTNKDMVTLTSGGAVTWTPLDSAVGFGVTIDHNFDIDSIYNITYNVAWQFDDYTSLGESSLDCDSYDDADPGATPTGCADCGFCTQTRDFAIGVGTAQVDMLKAGGAQGYSSHDVTVMEQQGDVGMRSFALSRTVQVPDGEDVALLASVGYYVGSDLSLQMTVQEIWDGSLPLCEIAAGDATRAMADACDVAGDTLGEVLYRCGVFTNRGAVGATEVIMTEAVPERSCFTMMNVTGDSFSFTPHVSQMFSLTNAGGDTILLPDEDDTMSCVLDNDGDTPETFRCTCSGTCTDTD